MTTISSQSGQSPGSSGEDQLPSTRGANEVIWDRVREKGSPLGRHVANIRWNELGMGRLEFCEAAGLDHQTLVRIEERRKPVRGFEIPCRLLNYLEERGYSAEALDRTAQLFAGDRLNHVGTFYRRLAYIAGLNVFAEKTGMNDKSIGVWQKKDNPPSFLRMKEKIEALFQKDARQEQYLAEGKDIWRKHAERWLVARKVPRPVAKLHTALEARELDEKASIQLMRENGIAREQGERLFRFEIVLWESVKPLAERVLTDEELTEFQSEWTVLVQDEMDAFDFTRPLQQMRSERGYSNALLAEALNVKVSGSQIAGDVVSGSIRGQPFHFFDASLYVLAHILCPAPALAAEEAQEVLSADQVLGRVRASREAYYLRNVPKLTAQRRELRLDREVYGVSEHALAEALGGEWTGQQVHAIEMSTGRKHAHRISVLRELTRTIAEKQLKTARSRLERLLRKEEQAKEKLDEPTTVCEVVRFGSAKLGGIRHIKSRLVSDDRNYRNTEITLAKIRDGLLVPSLPVFRFLTERIGYTMTPALLEDWQVNYAKMLKDVPRLRAGEIRSRALRVLIAQEFPNTREFCQARLPDESEKQIFHALKSLGDGKRHLPSVLEKTPIIIQALGVARDSQRGIFLENLFRTDGDLKEALIGWSHDVGLDEKPRPIYFPGASLPELRGHFNSQLVLDRDQERRKDEQLFRQLEASLDFPVSDEEPVSRNILHQWTIEVGEQIGENLLHIPASYGAALLLLADDARSQRVSQETKVKHGILRIYFRYK